MDGRRRDSPNSGPFITILFALIALPISFALYTLYRTTRRLREHTRNGDGGMVPGRRVITQERPTLWDVWTDYPTRSGRRALGTAKGIGAKWNQSLLRKPLSVSVNLIGSPNSVVAKRSKGVACAPGIDRIGQEAPVVRGTDGSRSGSGWLSGWSLNRGRVRFRHPTRGVEQGRKTEEDAEVEESESLGELQVEVHVAVVIALPSSPTTSESPNDIKKGQESMDLAAETIQQREENGAEEERREGSVVAYCLGTAKMPMQV